jgi:SulP family sulfate permease
MEDELHLTEQYLVNSIQLKPKERTSWCSLLYKETSNFFPWLSWLPKYNKHDIIGDIVAGVTVALMLVPQSMSYSMLAGLSAQHGLYSCFVPILAYSIFASSKQLAVGPVAILALMTASAVDSLSPKTEQDYVTYTHLIAIVTGCIQILLGLFRLGFLVNFMSHTVIAGFTSSAAIIIAGSQLQHIMGIKIPNENQIHLLVKQIVLNIRATHLPTFFLGLSCLTILFFMKYFSITIRGKQYNLNRIPSALTVVLLSAVSIYLMAKFGNDYDEEKKKVYGIKILGTVPSGISKPSMPIYLQSGSLYTFEHMKSIVLSSISIAFIGFLESMSVCKFMANKYKYQFDTNQELFALGVSCLSSGIFNGFPITGGLSRSAVNAQAGARTPLAGMITAILIMFTLLFLTKLLYFLPNVALASIIIIACLQFIDLEEFIYTFKTKKRDALSYAIAFVCTLFLGVDSGIMIATGISLFLVLYRASRPRHSILGRIPGTIQYRSINHWKNAITTPGILIIRFDSDLFFANASYIEQVVLECIEKEKYPVYALILDCNSMNEADSTAPATLKHLSDVIGPIRLYCAHMKPEIIQVLRNGGLQINSEEESTDYSIDMKDNVSGIEFYLNLNDAVLVATNTIKSQLLHDER